VVESAKFKGSGGQVGRPSYAFAWPQDAAAGQGGHVLRVDLTVLRRGRPMKARPEADIFVRVQLAPGANGVDVMRQALFAGLSIAVLVAVAIPDSSALARRRAPSAAFSGIQDRYCLQGRRWGYPGNCLFSTYEQCMATASGTPDYCGVNPQYLFAQPQGGYWPPR
jgi:hypothetical protein